MHYYGQRYYNQDIGRFLSQDPVFLAVGSEQSLKQLSGLKHNQYLADPQGFNSYSYTRNNPLKYVDEQGEWFWEFLTGRQSWSSFTMEIGEAANQLSQQSATWNFALDHPVATGAAVGVVGGLGAYGIVAAPGILTGSGPTIPFLAQNQDKVAETAAKGLKIGQSFGEVGTVVENIAGKVTGFTHHGAIQAFERGVPVNTILETTRNPLATLQQSGGTTLYLSEKAGVVLNQLGKIVTTYGSNLFKPHIQEIINQVKSSL